jgi:hypothetical protein
LRQVLGIDDCPRRLRSAEKISKQIPGRDAEKSDLVDCTTINDLMLGKGQVTPEKSYKSH